MNTPDSHEKGPKTWRVNFAVFRTIGTSGIAPALRRARGAAPKPIKFAPK